MFKSGCGPYPHRINRRLQIHLILTFAIASEVKELKYLRSDLEEELKKKDAELTQKLIGELREIVRAFSKKENYTLIMERSAVVAADDAIDITDKIIQIYDAQKK